MRGILAVHAGRPAGEYQPFGVEIANPLGGQIVPNQLAEHVLLANPPGNQLGGLRAEVHHQNPLFLWRRDGSVFGQGS
jgi:hypothetical protein